MTKLNSLRFGLLVGAWAAFLVVASAPSMPRAAEKTAKSTTDAPQVFAPMPVARLQTVLNEWITGQPGLAEESRTALAELWQDVPVDVSPRELMDRVLKSFQLVDAAAAKVLTVAQTAVVIDANELFADKVSPGAAHPFYQTNLRAAVAERLSQRRLFEEALDVMAPVDTNQLVDPAGFLFYKAVCEHALLQQEAGLKTLDQLLNHTEALPVRFEVLAKLMLDDLQQLKPKTLDEVARQMNDVERRLDFGRSGKKVQKVEDDIIATLDELIKKMEEQQQQQQAGGGAGSGNNPNNQSSNPAQDSIINGSIAPGEIDKKRMEKSGSWGELPPKQETDAKNLINRNFPSNYKQAIEEYFKKLAGRKAPAGR